MGDGCQMGNIGQEKPHEVLRQTYHEHAYRTSGYEIEKPATPEWRMGLVEGHAQFAIHHIGCHGNSGQTQQDNGSVEQSE